METSAADVTVWEVQFRYLRFDRELVNPDFVPTTYSFFVIADNSEEAKKKAKPELEDLAKKHPIHEITAKKVYPGNMIVAVHGYRSINIGWPTMVNTLVPVWFVRKEDAEKFRFEVRLVPIK